MLSNPAGRLVVEKVATPLTRETVPSEMAPFIKVTLPGGVVDGEVTVAVKVTGTPAQRAVAVEVSLAVVTAFTVVKDPADELEAKFVSPA